MPEAAGLARQPSGGPDAVLDACVLVPSSLRGLLLNAADETAFRPAWSEPILAEVKGVLLGKGGAGARGGMINPAQWQRLDQAMRGAFPQAMVPEREIRAIEPQMTNDRKDRHVLAAAVASGAPVVVTTNLKDFRAADVKRVGVQAMHPDAYLCKLLEQTPGAVASARTTHVNDRRASGRWSEGQLLGHLKGLGRGHAMAPRFAEQAESTLGIRAVAPPPRETASRPRSPRRSRGSPSLGR
jgi:predicted nucleic acid-binding protein